MDHHLTGNKRHNTKKSSSYQQAHPVNFGFVDLMSKFIVLNVDLYRITDVSGKTNPSSRFYNTFFLCFFIAFITMITMIRQLTHLLYQTNINTLQSILRES